MVFPKEFQGKIIARLDDGTLTWDYLKKKLELPKYSLLNLKTVVDRFRYIGINLNKELGNSGVYKKIYDRRCEKVRMKLKTKKNMCQKCFVSFDTKQHLNQHINSKNCVSLAERQKNKGLLEKPKKKIKLVRVKGPTINIKPDPEMLWNHIYKTLIKK